MWSQFSQLVILYLLLIDVSNVQSASAVDKGGACGLGNDPTSVSKTIGGTIAPANEFPWLSYLTISMTINGVVRSSACNGALIDSKWILTSATCLDRPNSNLTILLGAQYLADFNEISRVVVNSDYKVIIHPDWNENTKKGDIALIRLPKDVPFSNYIRPVCLPVSTDPDHVGDSVTLIGWKLTISADGKSKSTEFRKVTSQIISNGQCQSSVAKEIEFNNKFMCTTSSVGSSCAGDGGGPMNFKNPDGSWSTIGIVSFGNGSCIIGTPTVFTRIGPYIDWIQSVRYDFKLTTVPSTSSVMAKTTQTTAKPYKGEANSITIPAAMIIVCLLVAQQFN